jgi:hypothetical protein
MKPRVRNSVRNFRSISDVNRTYLALRRGQSPILYYNTMRDWAALRGLGALFPFKYWVWSQLSKIGKSSSLRFPMGLFKARGTFVLAQVAKWLKKSDAEKFHAVHVARRALKRFGGCDESDIAIFSNENAPTGFAAFSRNSSSESETVLVVCPKNAEPAMARAEFLANWPVTSTKVFFFSLDSLESSEDVSWTGADFAKIMLEIRSCLAGETRSRLGVVGVSAGGAPAIILGFLLGADYVLAAGPTSPLKFAEVLHALQRGPASTFAEIIYARDCSKDEKAAREWAELVPGISLKPVATSEHTVFRYLATRRLLSETLADCIESKYLTQ